MTGERRSKELEELRAPLAPMIEEYNHGKEFPKLKSLPGLRFRRRADPRESRDTGKSSSGSGAASKNQNSASVHLVGFWEDQGPPTLRLSWSRGTRRPSFNSTITVVVEL